MSPDPRLADYGLPPNPSLAQLRKLIEDKIQAIYTHAKELEPHLRPGTGMRVARVMLLGHEVITLLYEQELGRANQKDVNERMKDLNLHLMMVSQEQKDAQP